MAFSVVLEKMSEDEQQVTYRYGPDLTTQGIIKLDLVADRYVNVQEPASEEAGMEFKGAIQAIARARIRGAGYPDVLTHRA